MEHPSVKPRTDDVTRVHDPRIPDGIESPRTKLVYLYLSVMGAATIDRLQVDLGVNRLTLFPVLRTLVNRGYVESVGHTYVARGG